jgi:hypothetical protein
MSVGFSLRLFFGFINLERKKIFIILLRFAVEVH